MTYPCNHAQVPLHKKVPVVLLSGKFFAEFLSHECEMIHSTCRAAGKNKRENRSPVQGVSISVCWDSKTCLCGLWNKV